MPSPSIAALAGIERQVIVGIGSLAVSNNPGIILTAYSLGSCLGVTIYDPVCRAGGLLHVMLPQSSINPARAAERPGMFVDTGFAALLRAVYALKAAKHRLLICVAGGAQFLDNSGFFNIGQRNYNCLAQLLIQLGLSIDAQDAGGLVSRTLSLHLRTGEVRLKSSGQREETTLSKGYANIG
jgi:chemotaxis protein CheD